jgi:hypothetical protein
MKIKKKDIEKVKKYSKKAYELGGKFLDVMGKAARNIEKNQKKKKKSFEMELPDL